VLIRPDGHVAWAGDLMDPELPQALATWFGAANPAHRTRRPSATAPITYGGRGHPVTALPVRPITIGFPSHPPICRGHPPP
jgi:hypothetical protein